MRFPQLAVVDVLNPLPNLSLAAMLVPSSPEVAVIEAKHLWRKPRGDMHAIRDVPDGNCFFRLTRIQSRPHRARCSSMRPASKRSWPAGTGVCVVKDTSRETRGTA